MPALLQIVVSSRSLDTLKSVRIYNRKHGVLGAKSVHRCPYHRTTRLLPIVRDRDRLICRCPHCDFYLVVR